MTDHTTITIDGPTIDREDGSTVCVGYYTDAEGRVVSRFALPPGEYDVDAAVEGVEYVDALGDLPPANEHYRSSL